MPIGPIGQTPIDRTPDSSNAKSDATTTSNKGTFQTQGSAQASDVGSQPDASSPARIATQLVQSARAQGTNPSITAPLGDLVNAVTSQLGMPELSNEHRQKLVAQLADDPVVKGLIG